MTDLVTFITETATIITGQIPLQSYDDALILVESYISNIGGWIPDDVDVPNGEGVPANDFTTQEAADDITGNSFGSIYDLNFQISVTLDVQIAAKLSQNLTLEDAAISISNQVSDFVTDSINGSVLPLRIASVDVQTPISERSVLSGMTTSDIRQLIATDITSGDKLVDYKARTLKYVHDTYGVNNTWNVSWVYTQPNEPITVEIQKYTNSTYLTIDPDSTVIYVITVSPTTYAIVSGVILNLA